MNVAARHGEESKEQHIKEQNTARAIDRFFTRLIPRRRQVRNAQTGSCRFESNGSRICNHNPLTRQRRFHLPAANLPVASLSVASLPARPDNRAIKPPEPVIAGQLSVKGIRGFPRGRRMWHCRACFRHKIESRAG